LIVENTDNIEGKPGFSPAFFVVMQSYVKEAGLANILEKVSNKERLSLDDGLQLYRSNDILALGYLANIVRNRKNGDDTFFIYNQHVNYSNICTNLCKFCAFGKEKESDLAYEMSVDEVKEKISQRLDEPITEIHMVGGIHPELPFEYYLEVLQGIKEVRPDVHIQAFTCVEIAHLASLANKSVEKTLEVLMEAGLGSIPGGGAEVFSPRIRQLTCDTEMSELSSTTGVDDLKNMAVARLMLDNFPHIKAYWIMLGPKLAQIALSFGADDMDGTVKEEVITHMAGAETDQTIGSSTLIRLIREAGRNPIERDTLYNVINRPK